MKELTLAFLLREDEICLALKKRGFGVGNWNGYGGKIEIGETILTAAVREIEEESEVVMTEPALEKITEIEYIFEDGDHLFVHTYFVRDWQGEPVETEEMKPAWFHFGDIPYDDMWEDDQYWLPRVIAGEKLRGTCWFDASGKGIKRMEWSLVDEFENN